MKKFVLVLLFILITLPAWAAQIMSPVEVRQGVLDGEIVLIDIRTPGEWRQTGIGDVALPITMHNSEFLTRVQSVAEENPGKQLAFICAVGGRSGHVTRLLENNGYTNLIDVAEGMTGSRPGEGWIPRGLPVKAQ